MDKTYWTHSAPCAVDRWAPQHPPPYNQLVRISLGQISQVSQPVMVKGKLSKLRNCNLGTLVCLPGSGIYRYTVCPESIDSF